MNWYDMDNGMTRYEEERNDWDSQFHDPEIGLHRTDRSLTRKIPRMSLSLVRQDMDAAMCIVEGSGSRIRPSPTQMNLLSRLRSSSSFGEFAEDLGITLSSQNSSVSPYSRQRIFI